VLVAIDQQHQSLAMRYYNRRLTSGHLKNVRDRLQHSFGSTLDIATVDPYDRRARICGDEFIRVEQRALPNPSRPVYVQHTEHFLSTVDYRTKQVDLSRAANEVLASPRGEQPAESFHRPVIAAGHVYIVTDIADDR
jgi:hypothetical protein